MKLGLQVMMLSGRADCDDPEERIQTLVMMRPADVPVARIETRRAAPRLQATGTDGEVW